MSSVLRLPTLWVLCFSIITGCSNPQPVMIKSASGKNPMIVQVAKTDRPTVAELKESTGVRLEIPASNVGNRPLRQRFDVGEKLVHSDSDINLKADFQDIPVKIKGARVKGRIWELEFPPNLIRFLAKSSSTVRYDGALVLDGSGNALPLTLVLRHEESYPRSAG